MTNLNDLSTFEQPHRQPREFLDCPAAPLDPDTTEIGQDETLPVPEGAYLELDDEEPEVRHERPDPYDEMVDRQAVERDMMEQETMRRDFERSIYREVDKEDALRDINMSALGRDLFEFGARLSRAQAKGEL